METTIPCARSSFLSALNYNPGLKSVVYITLHATEYYFSKDNAITNLLADEAEVAILFSFDSICIYKNKIQRMKFAY